MNEGYNAYFEASHRQLNTTVLSSTFLTGIGWTSTVHYCETKRCRMLRLILTEVIYYYGGAK
jgi:hypothetical protein